MQISDYMSNWDFSYCDCILLMIQDFQRKLGFIWDGSKDSLNVLLLFLSWEFIIL